MKTNMRVKGPGRKGSILLLTMVMSAIISMLTLSYFLIVQTETESVTTEMEWAKAKALAEGGLQIASKEALEMLSNNSLKPGIRYVVISGNVVEYLIRDLSEENPALRSLVEDPVTHIRSFYSTYEIVVTARPNNTPATIHRQVLAKQTPLFQFAMFSDQNLELHPEGTMTLDGRIQANGNIHLGGSTGSTLDITTSHLYSGGDILKASIANALPADGTVIIDNTKLTTDSSDPSWEETVLSNWSGTVKTGTEQFKIPQLGSIKQFSPTLSGTGGDYTKDPVTGEIVKLPEDKLGTGDYEKGFYHREAELVIIDDKAFIPDPDNEGEMLDITAKLNSNPSNSVFVEKEFFDKNVGKNVKVTELDLNVLKTSGFWPSNGLIYVARTDCTKDQPNGVRLDKQSGLLDALTLVTPNPMYLQGHYNDANSKPAAIICDSINFLSTSWNDDKVDRDLDKLTVGGTSKFNLAIIAGQRPSSLGKYGGGMENFGSYQECWAGNYKGDDGLGVVKRERIGVHKNWFTGAMISLGESEFAAPWEPANYVAPQRQWEYDTNFNDFTKLPPYTPMLVSIQSSVLKIDRGSETAQAIWARVSGTSPGNVTPVKTTGPVK